MNFRIKCFNLNTEVRSENFSVGSDRSERQMLNDYNHFDHLFLVFIHQKEPKNSILTSIVFIKSILLKKSFED